MLKPLSRRSLLPLAALLAAGLPSSAAWAADVVVVKSKGISAYNDAVTAFNTVCKANFKEYDMEGKEDRAEKIAELINANPPSLVFAVGSQAAQMARTELDSSIPFVFAMVLDYQKAGIKADNSTGISMTIPAGQYLGAVKSIVPGTKRVGVVYNPKKTQPVIDEAQKAAKDLGIQLLSAKVETKEDTLRALNASFSAGIDALWMIQDPTVATEEAFLTMLDYSSTNKIPFIVFSDGMVEGGALASLAVSPQSLGAQAGGMANRILLGNRPSSIPVENPQKLQLSINLDTARKIGRECDIALNIFTYAARQDFGIKVFGGQ